MQYSDKSLFLQLKYKAGGNLESNYVFGVLFAGKVNISEFAFTKWTTNLKVIQLPFLPARWQKTMLQNLQTISHWQTQNR